MGMRAGTRRLMLGSLAAGALAGAAAISAVLGT
jgi:hypothetical protein